MFRLGPRPFLAARPGIIWASALAFWLGAAAAMAGAADAADDEIDWAKERSFWSFQRPIASAQPAVKNRRWPRQPLDYFVLQKLEQREVAPSPEANRRALARRVTFDLTGLAPAPEEVERFCADPRDDAYERLVERLLGSPRFGERLASMWLPLARYAEDQAHQVGSDTKYFYPNAYKYRQWVIDAFNRDLPYDEFLRLQLAADQLTPPRTNDLAALGFLGLGPKYYNRDRLEVMSDEWEDRVDTVTRTMLGLTVACARCHDHKFEPITTRDYYAIAGVFASIRMVNKSPAGRMEDGKTEAGKMAADTLHIVEDGEAKDLNVFVRGKVDRKGPVVPRRFLQLLGGGEASAFHEGSGRKELACAIACRENPLTARVIVNRVWEWVFGRGIVETESNFGHSGGAPTHPALLDDLAARFMQRGWSIKSLVRELVSSATYRQASAVGEHQRQQDPANTWFSRMNRRRLTVEQWRDSVLLVGENLQLEGGPSPELDAAENHRRTVHARISRLKLNDLLVLWDYPDANVHAEGRSVTTTATQKLFLLNNPFVLAQAKRVAARVAREANEPDRIPRVYQLLFGRAPDREEEELGRKFLAAPTTASMSRWEQYAQLLLVSNEMLYID